MENLLTLPRDILFSLLSGLDFTSLSRICSSSKEFDSICQDPAFWAFKYTHNFNEPFPSKQINLNDSAKQVYLRRWLKDLDHLSKDLYEELKFKIHNILIVAAKKDERDKMELVYEYMIDRLIEFEKVETPLKDLKAFLDGKPTGILLDIAEELSELFYENDITELKGVELVSITQGDDASDEEIQTIDKLFLEIVDAFFEYEVKLLLVNQRQDTVFKVLATNPFEPDTYMYMVMSKKEELENRNLSRNPRFYLNYPNPTNLNTGHVQLPLPSNLPPPPPRAPLLSKLTLPPPLPRDFPTPGHGPAHPGSRVPSNLPPAPLFPDVAQERGILWWGLEMRTAVRPGQRPPPPLPLPQRPPPPPQRSRSPSPTRSRSPSPTRNPEDVNLKNFEIHAKTVYGTNYKLTVNAQTKIRQIKNQIQDLGGVPPENQILIFAGRRLQDESELSDYNLGAYSTGATLHLIFDLKGD